MLLWLASLISFWENIQKTCVCVCFASSCKATNCEHVEGGDSFPHPLYIVPIMLVLICQQHIVTKLLVLAVLPILKHRLLKGYSSANISDITNIASISGEFCLQITLHPQCTKINTFSLDDTLPLVLYLLNYTIIIDSYILNWWRVIMIHPYTHR